MKEKVGVIGLGAMGSGMARNILKGGFPLWVYDLCPETLHELVARGAQAAEDITDIGERCDWIVFALPDASVVESVLFGTDGLKPALKPGHILIDCGTSHPVFAQQAAETLHKAGIAFLDAPVSGMPSGAEAGTLTVMVGGDENAYNTVTPLLETIGETIVHMGPAGNGQLAKITNNVLYNISCAAMAEVLPMAAKMGLDSEKICSVVSSGTGQSYGFDFFSPLILQRNFTPGYPMQSAYKDMATIMEIANQQQIPLPVTTATMQTYQMALAQNLGAENKGAMIKVWESLLGVEVKGIDGNTDKEKYANEKAT